MGAEPLVAVWAVLVLAGLFVGLIRGWNGAPPSSILRIALISFSPVAILYSLLLVEALTEQTMGWVRFGGWLREILGLAYYSVVTVGGGYAVGRLFKFVSS